MIQTVIKRDGRIVGFNEEKIAAAIRKAMLHSPEGEDEELIKKIIDRIACKGNEQMHVEEIQDLVEFELMKSRSVNEQRTLFHEERPYQVVIRALVVGIVVIFLHF